MYFCWLIGPGLGQASILPTQWFLTFHSLYEHSEVCEKGSLANKLQLLPLLEKVRVLMICGLDYRVDTTLFSVIETKENDRNN